MTLTREISLGSIVATVSVVLSVLAGVIAVNTRLAVVEAKVELILQAVEITPKVPRAR